MENSICQQKVKLWMETRADTAIFSLNMHVLIYQVKATLIHFLKCTFNIQ